MDNSDFASGKDKSLTSSYKLALYTSKLIKKLIVIL